VGTVDASHYALTIDIAPTIAELAGVTPATPVDGASLVPILSSPAAAWRTAFLIEDFFPRLLHGVLVSGEDGHAYKYVELGGGQEVELYDLTADPWELVNLANDSAHAETRAWLEVLFVLEDFSDASSCQCPRSQHCPVLIPDGNALPNPLHRCTHPARSTDHRA
jgi:hypothetical protein